MNPSININGARCLLLLLTALFLTSYASVPKDYPRIESTAFADHDGTAIGK